MRTWFIRSGSQTARGTSAWKLEDSLSRCFDIDLSSGPVVGQSGGVFGLFRKTSGFAMVADGKNDFTGHHVIAVRGTKGNHDWLTNANVGLSTSTGGALVHAGFNKTFESMKPALEALLTPRLNGGAVAGVHCIGHSLGGALASLVADWIHKRYRREASLYTFGAPRVGMKGFATNSTFEVHKLYRCTHGADPVPALITLLKDAGYYSVVLAQAAISTTLTFYDLLAHTLEDIAKASAKFADQTRGLLGHMLAFARVAVTTVVELSFRFIRWVFDRTAGALYDAVRQAIERT